MRFLKSIDWIQVLIVATIAVMLSLIIYLIWEQYHWRKLPDGRIYRIKHTCLSSHTENQYVPQTSINPSNGQVTTVMVWQTTTICDCEQLDTVWKETTLTK